MCQSDEQCIQRCLDGQPQVYRQLVQRHERAVLAYLRAKLGDQHLAEEAAQEAFVRAYFSLGKLRKRASFLSWVLGIATRTGQEVLRSRTRMRSSGDLLDQPAPAPATAPDEGLAKALSHLSEVYREVIALRYHAGLGCAEVAQKLGVPLGTVTKRLSRAYALLREALTQHSSNEVNR